MFALITYKMLQLTMLHEVCKYSITGFVQFAAMLCGNKLLKDIEVASRIEGGAIYFATKRFHTTEQLPKFYFAYYGFVAFNTEPLQSCAAMLRQGFNVGLLLEENETDFHNDAIQHTKSFLSCGLLKMSSPRPI